MPACGWASLLENITSDAKPGAVNIQRFSLTKNAEACQTTVPQASLITVFPKTWPADREQRARIIGDWLKTEARFLAQ